MNDLIDMDEVRHRLGLMITALDIRYDIKGDHPLIGRRIPDADITTPDGDTRIHELLHTARPILLLLNGTRTPAVTAWTDRIDIVHASTHADRWAIPGIGEIPNPAAIFIRSDGYVAWATAEPDNDGLTESLTSWVGPAF